MKPQGIIEKLWIVTLETEYRVQQVFSWVTNKNALSCVAEFLKLSVRSDSFGPRLWDPELEAFTSDCVALQASGYLMRYSRSSPVGMEYAALAGALLSSVLARSNCQDWFGIPYNAQSGKSAEVDLAEFGASSFGLREFFGSPVHAVAKSISDKVVDVVISRVHSQNPGAFQKTQSVSPNMDVLNADLYAALALSTGQMFGSKYDLAGQLSYTIQHLRNRFGAAAADRWSYSENVVDGSVVLGYSAAYQATIIGWGWILTENLPTGLKQDWGNTLHDAYFALGKDLAEGPNDQTESARWARNWNNVWETRLALCNEGGIDTGETGLERINGVRILSVSDAQKAFQISEEPTVGRSVVTSTLRKMANFGSVISALDHIRINPNRFH